MGCGASVPAAPEVLIPDPGPQEACVFTITSAGFMSADHIVCKGEDKTAKWLFINKTGNFRTGSAQVQLENFQRGGTPGKPDEGQVLWSAQFNDKPEFRKFHKAPTNTYDPFQSGFFGSPPAGQRSDEEYFNAAPGFMNDRGWRRVMKWRLSQGVAIKSGTRAIGINFLLKVFVTGTSICDYDKKEGLEGPGQEEYTTQTASFVDTMEFQLTDMQSGQPVAQWWVPGDFQGNADLDQMSSTPVISTALGWDPTLALLVAYFCTFEYSPFAIKNDLETNFPSTPTGWPGY
eukprot:TRINITY_DN29650_c0_g1_i2.p1 TRINITY_DN29650_c0_g1~~TRINITY_DN29650_c0_g1_i2.p1  ORF type:complete len:289 (-),score=59.15 TRINITY_DN29650_c0_g1_i2:34-900(-)